MENKKNKKRTIKDGAAIGLTYFSSSVSILVLFGIILFIMFQGASFLNFKMITSDYYETPYFAYCDIKEGSSFDLEDKDNVYYSKVWGIGLKNDKDLSGNDCIVIEYIDNLSPLKNARALSSDDIIAIEEGKLIKRIQLEIKTGNLVLTPKLGAKEIATKLDEGHKINELYFVTMGGGIRGSLISTLYLIISTLLFSLPIGITAAIYLGNYARNNKITKGIRTLIDMIAGIPSIIFGLIGVIIFIPFVSGMTKNNGGSILAGAFTLSIMLLPTIIKNTEEAIHNIPKGYKMSSLALGASEVQTISKVILPNAMPGILTGVLLSIGRIIGESAALIFAIGTAIQDNVSIFKGSATLAVHIWSVMSGENPNYAQACAISIVILIVVLIINISIKIICKKFQRFEVK